MKLEEIMTTEVITVGMDESLEVVRMLFERSHFHHVLVLDEDDTLVGVVSDRDLLKALSPFISTLAERPQDLHTLKRRVHQIMSRSPVTVDRTATVRGGAALMLENRISCLPIVRPDNTVEGIVTWKDILKWLVEQPR